MPGESSSDHAAPTAAVVKYSACGSRGCETDRQSGFGHFLYTVSYTDCKLSSA